MKKVRFLHNFVMTVTQTTVDGDGKLVVDENDFHMGVGDVYVITQYDEHEDGRVDLYFPDSSPLSGVARNVESDYCELRNPSVPNTTVTLARGCGGCNT
jgi:hypothetical protein